MIEHETTQASHTTQGLLLLWFIAMVAGWWYLIFNVPILIQGGFPGFHVNRETGVATFNHHNQAAGSAWAQQINFDVRSGVLQWSTSRDLGDWYGSMGAPRGSMPTILPRDTSGNPLPPDQYRVIAPLGSTTQDRFFSFPEPPIYIEDHYVVAVNTNKLFVLDYEAESPEVVTTDIGGATVIASANLLGDIVRIDGFRGFLSLQTLPTIGNPPSYQVQHFSIQDDLTVKLNATWTVINLGTFPLNSVGFADDKIVSFNPANFELEFRDTSSGELIESIPLLNGMDPVTMPCYFWPNFLRIEPTTSDAPRFLDLKSRQWLPLIEGVNFSPHVVLDDKFILFRGLTDTSKTGLACKVFDVKRQDVIATFDAGSFTEFIDEESILDVSARSGLTFNQLDVQTGKVLKSNRPFWWVIPLTSFLCVSWLAWTWVWLTKSARFGPSAVWLDIALIALVPLALCIFRVNVVGPVEDLFRIPTKVGQGIVFTLLVVGVVWLIHTRHRIVPRILPILLAATILVVSVSISFRGQLNFIVPVTMQAFFPLSGCLIYCAILRRIGIRLVPQTDSESSTPKQNSRLVTIGDMFILTGVLAVLFAFLAPWLPSVGFTQGTLAQSVFWQSAILALAPVVAWCLAMSSRRFRWLGHVLFSGTFAFLIASAAWRFSGTSSLIDLMFGFYPAMDALPAICFVTAYWIATCFRFRGWRFRRFGKPQLL